MKRIAIVGMGISGMGVLNAYYKMNPKDVQIDCYDSEESFGRGFPFREDVDAALLNVRPHIIGFDYENPTEFADWLKKQPEYADEEFVPRKVYGEFLHENTMQILEKIPATAIFEQVKDLDFDEENQKWTLSTDKTQENYDLVHLCCGELPTADYYNLKGQKNYIHSIYPLKKTLPQIQDGEHVCVIGTSLSAIDVMRYLYNHKKDIKISVFSNNTVFPTIRQKEVNVEERFLTRENIAEIKKHNNGFMTFEQADTLIKQEYEQYGIDILALIEKYTQGFDSVETCLEEDKALQIAQSLNIGIVFNKMWQGLTDEDKDKFKERYSMYLSTLFSPMPEKTGKMLVEKKEIKQLNVLENVKKIIKKDSVFLIQNEDGKTLCEADWVVNATGLDSSFKSLKEGSLLYNLVQKGIILPYKYGGITVAIDGYSVLSSKYGEMISLSAHGVLVKGVELLNNGAKMIQDSADEKINQIWNRI